MGSEVVMFYKFKQQQNTPYWDKQLGRKSTSVTFPNVLSGLVDEAGLVPQWPSWAKET